MTLLENYTNNEFDGVVFANEISQRYFNLMNPSHNRLAFTNGWITYTGSFYYPKETMLKDLFTEHLQRFRENGLITHWTHQFTDVHSSKLPQKVPPMKLRIENILIAFQIVAIMYLISFIVFILEIITVKFHRIRYAIDYLTY